MSAPDSHHTPDTNLELLKLIAALGELYRCIPGVGMALLQQRCPELREQELAHQLMPCSMLLAVDAQQRAETEAAAGAAARAARHFAEGDDTPHEAPEADNTAEDDALEKMDAGAFPESGPSSWPEDEPPHNGCSPYPPPGT
ncbi:hypothetical protein [Amycolatopsis aidingensis]|uniref:hypothetical protein n=1 Tax=Amycolatopsis aidingensis TaxID=2842453 RepID=UPI001C0E65AA|nr:hypothetical protein [Amycolatopsis aidingensis]